MVNGELVASRGDDVILDQSERTKDHKEYHYHPSNVYPYDIVLDVLFFRTSCTIVYVVLASLLVSINIVTWLQTPYRIGRDKVLQKVSGEHLESESEMKDDGDDDSFQRSLLGFRNEL